jgi:hypothetical protein
VQQGGVCFHEGKEGVHEIFDDIFSLALFRRFG